MLLIPLPHHETGILEIRREFAIVGIQAYQKKARAPVLLQYPR
jgi:hypothetical protein